MFGMHPELEHRLRKHGTRARATVLEARQGHLTNSDGSGRAANVTTDWYLKVEVHPDGAPAFQADVDSLFGQFAGPSVGQELAVIFDPADHAKVVVDQSPDGQIDSATQTIAAQLGSHGLEVDTARLATLLKEGRDHPGSVDPAAMRAAMGVPEGSGTVVNLSTTVGEAPGASADPVELLEKLAQLHRNGDVSDEEFAAQKKRLLGE